MSDDKNDRWEMPQPVFRSSTGALPRSLEETISHSFVPNAETIEIDEDDDILSIMDTPYRPEPPTFEEHSDAEKTLEIDREVILEMPPKPDPEQPEHTPIVVTAKKPDEPASNNSESGLFVFVLIVLIVIAIVAAIFYNFSQPIAAP